MADNGIARFYLPLANPVVKDFTIKRVFQDYILCKKYFTQRMIYHT